VFLATTTRNTERILLFVSGGQYHHTSNIY
jgi:hypothetical protein